MKRNENYDLPASLLAFTFFYAVTIYVFLLGYHFWSQNRRLEELEDSED